MIDTQCGVDGCGRLFVQESSLSLSHTERAWDLARFQGQVESGPYLPLIEPRVQPTLREDTNLEAPASIGNNFRPSFAGPLILAGGFTQETAEQALNKGIADAIGFGHLFISNPDLPQHLAMNAELNSYDRAASPL